MQSLTIENINTIEEEVSRSGVTFSHLREELIDHLCCDVEREMKQGISFEHAFAKMQGIIGNKGLKKIQENTLLLIDKKYRIMKKTMKIFGLVSLLLMTMGALFKIQHWPGAGIMLVFGFFLLGTVFFPSALWVMKKESKLKGSFFIYLISIIGGICLMAGFLFKVQHYPQAGNLLLIGYTIIALLLIPAILISLLQDEKSKNLHVAYIIGAVSLMFYLFGQLFKFTHWPGAGPLLIVGAIGLTTIFLPVYAYKVFKNTESIKTGFIFICIGIFFLNLYSFLLALNVSKDVFVSSVTQGEEIVKTTKLLESKNDRLYDSFVSDSSFQDISIKANAKRVRNISDEMCDYIETIKVDLIAKTDNVSIEEAAKKAKDFSTIIAKNNYDKPTFYMLDENNNGKAYQLRSKIEKFKNELFSINGISETEKTIVLKLFDMPKEIVNENGIKTGWEMTNFYLSPLIFVENSLSSLQRNIRVSEGEVLESFVCKVGNETAMSSEKLNNKKIKQ